MRIKLQAKILEKENKSKTNYNHEVYAMILANIDSDKAKNIHAKKRFKRLFTFSDLYINENQIHIYISGDDVLIKNFINNIIFNQIVRIGDMVVAVTNITPLDNELSGKEKYKFKTNFIINDKKDGKVHLSDDMEYIKKRISQIINDKHNEINGTTVKEMLNVDIVKCKHIYTKYKNHHINSYKAIVEVSGNLELINTLYNVGIGENTATGHGFVWEVI